MTKTLLFTTTFEKPHTTKAETLRYKTNLGYIIGLKVIIGMKSTMYIYISEFKTKQGNLQPIQTGLIISKSKQG